MINYVFFKNRANDNRQKFTNSYRHLVWEYYKWWFFWCNINFTFFWYRGFGLQVL